MPSFTRPGISLCPSSRETATGSVPASWRVRPCVSERTRSPLERCSKSTMSQWTRKGTLSYSNRSIRSIVRRRPNGNAWENGYTRVVSFARSPLPTRSGLSPRTLARSASSSKRTHPCTVSGFANQNCLRHWLTGTFGKPWSVDAFSSKDWPCTCRSISRRTMSLRAVWARAAPKPGRSCDGRACGRPKPRCGRDTTLRSTRSGCPISTTPSSRWFAPA